MPELVSSSTVRFDYHRHTRWTRGEAATWAGRSPLTVRRWVADVRNGIRPRFALTSASPDLCPYEIDAESFRNHIATGQNCGKP